MNSGEFSKFFDKATRLMERALCETVDITFDYSGVETEDMEGWVYYFTTSQIILPWVVWLLGRNRK